MALIEEKKNPSGCVLWLIRLAALVAIGYIFLDEVLAGVKILRAGWNLVRKGEPTGELPWLTIEALTSTVLIGVLFFFVVLFLLSQAVLPVGNLKERREVFTRVFKRIFNRQGAAAFVQDGTTRSGLVELQSRRPGMIFVDASSAVVVAQHGSLNKGMRPARVLGTGVNFTQTNEAVRGIVDLRVQRRTAKNVPFITKDGIEVQCDVTVDFSISEAPAILSVALCGDMADDVRVIKIDPHNHRVVGILDDFDLADKHEIFSQSRIFQESNVPSARLETSERRLPYPPLPIDTGRVLSAIFAQGVPVKEDARVEWNELPEQRAISFLKQLVEGQFFNDLFARASDGQGFMMQAEFRPNFERWMQTEGVLSYQIIRKRDGSLPEIGEVLHHAAFWISPVMSLTNFKMLRARGIKVISATFGDLRATSEKVQQMRDESWYAKRQSEPAAQSQAASPPVAEMHNRARQQAQRDLNNKLTLLLEDPNLSEQEQSRQIMNIFSSLAKDPYVRSFIPTMSLNRFDEIERYMKKYGAWTEDTGGEETYTNPQRDL